MKLLGIKNNFHYTILTCYFLMIHLNCLTQNPSLNPASFLTSLLDTPMNVIGENSDPVASGTAESLTPIDLSIWTKRAKITIDNSAQSENLINFPVLVRLTSGTFNYTNAKADGSDIRFSDSTGAFRLDFEMDTWIYNGTSVFWVKIPLIPANSNTSFIWIYYGNPTATSIDLGAATWDANYKAVYHLTNLNDSTSNSHTLLACNGLTEGTVGDTEVAPSTVVSFYGLSRSFDGSKNCLRIPANILTSGSTHGSIELSIFSIYVPLAGATMNLFSHSSSPENTMNNRLKLSIYNTTGTGCVADTRRMYVGLGNDFINSCLGDTSINLSDSFLSVGVIALTWNNGNYNIHINSSIYSSSYNQTGLLLNGMNEEIGLGARFNEVPKGFFSGIIDEVRLSDTVRSMNWLKAQYLSKTYAFLMLGAEESI